MWLYYEPVSRVQAILNEINELDKAMAVRDLEMVTMLLTRIVTQVRTRNRNLMRYN